MKKAITEYKQAIIIGASPMGSEESALLKLLKWAGYGEQAEHCSRDCNTCHTGCSAKIKNKDIYVVVADGGLKFLLKNGMLPDFFVGDLDSVELEEIPTEKTQSDGMQTEDTPTGKARPEGALKDILKDIPKEIVPVEKDDTDMLAAIRIGLLEGCQEFRIYGGMGGRLEHTLANLQCLIYLKQCSAVGYLMDDKTTAFVMQNETVWFKPEAKGFLSLFSIGEKASGVTIRNLKYEMQDGEITNSFPIGISNEFIGKRSSVTVEQGMLAVILSEKE